MNETKTPPETTDEEAFDRRGRGQTEQQAALIESVGEKATRRLAARNKQDRSLWFGLGAFGVIGWSVAIPTLVGVALGLWLDWTMTDDFSWTLALLLGGVALGCFNAWYWISKEQGAMEVERKRMRHE